MNDVPCFPDDSNGDVLRRMYEHNDDLLQPRNIDFCFIFPERRQAIAFAEVVDEQELEVCIAYYEEQERWQATVRRYMIPTHQDITDWETKLTTRAESKGGEADGWGCLQVDKKD